MDDGLDVGLDIINVPVPFAAARLNHYWHLEGSAFLDTSKMDLADILAGEKIPEDAYDYADEVELIYGYDSNGKKIYRPFKALFYVNYRPYDRPNLSFIPLLGFSLNPMYHRLFAIEGGLTVRYDFANIFIPALGIHYMDRVWHHSVDCMRRVHTPPFRALIKGMYPETYTLPKQHTPSL